MWWHHHFPFGFCCYVIKRLDFPSESNIQETTCLTIDASDKSLPRLLICVSDRERERSLASNMKPCNGQDNEDVQFTQITVLVLCIMWSAEAVQRKHFDNRCDASHSTTAFYNKFQTKPQMCEQQRRAYLGIT